MIDRILVAAPIPPPPPPPRDIERDNVEQFSNANDGCPCRILKRSLCNDILTTSGSEAIQVY